MQNIIQNLHNRVRTSADTYSSNESKELNSMRTRLGSRGGPDQWVRMREAKLSSLKKALLYSYQSAVVQKYDINNKYPNPLFRCLINHDKLKVDYEDKIISIPFEEIPIGYNDVMETNFHNGTVFKWVHGNKEEWTPDTYWIVYMQYSEETAYFRAEIRKADQEIEIINIDEQGNENTNVYRGWMTGPNETTILWNTKKNITWNDLNYTKILYITKDQNTSAFFKRFDRVIINGQPWEIQAYNQNYSNNKSSSFQGGIIRVALKETYTSTNEFIKDVLTEKQKQDNNIDENPCIIGLEKVKPFAIVSYTAYNFSEQKEWNLSQNNGLARIINISQDGLTATIEILATRSNKQGFYINYGDSDDTKKHIIIESF